MQDELPTDINDRKWAKALLAGEWHPEILEFIESAVGAARSGNENATRHLLAFFAKCLRQRLLPPEPLALFVADELDRQILPPPEQPGVDLLGAMLGSDPDAVTKVIQDRYTSKPGPFFGLTNPPRGRPPHSFAVERARTLAVKLEMARMKVGVTEARKIVSDRFDDGSGKDMTKTLERAEEKTRKAATDADRLKKWFEQRRAEREADLAASEAAGRPGCISVVLAREYGPWPAGETLRVDPGRAAWLLEKGYAAQVSETAAEAAAAGERYRACREFAKVNRPEPAVRLTWGDRLGEIILEEDPTRRQ